MHDVTLYIENLPLRQNINIDNKMVIWGSTIDLIPGRVIYPEEANMILSSLLSIGQATKYLKILHESFLKGDLGESVVKRLPGDNMYLTLAASAINTAITRFRILQEMDDFSLSEFDSMSLQDVDFADIT